MADKGPILTSIIIFYLSIGAAIFQILEEPNWKSAVQTYKNQTEAILNKYPCLKREDLEHIIEVSKMAKLRDTKNKQTKSLGKDSGLFRREVLLEAGIVTYTFRYQRSV